MLMLSKKQVEQILNDIQKNKKYSSISRDLIKKEIKKYFQISPKSISLLEKTQSKKYKEIIKKIRNRLHLVYGSFQTKSKAKMEGLLREIDGINDYKTHDKILSLSVSSKERLKDYEKIYSSIFKITTRPKKIIDLGCGLNPISYPYMHINNLVYYAYDIDQKDIAFLDNYFNIIGRYTKIKGKAFVADLKDLDIVKELPRADICFMFKLVDVLERRGHKLSEELIKSLKCKHIVVSFPTKTVSGRNMRHPYRGWIEKMLDRIGYKFERIVFDNEVFYIISKS
jgi:16S rRNA (guanine(1405)-N(7))-methyltransferase